ncbi:MAG: xanthine dehydrogenase family protein molybdopterin-binding subunit [Rhodospirillales bacterium]|nr:xanthine dehydrogenase family protein molybdopterin-binding subunit [Rhodospirillales bacterium]
MTLQTSRRGFLLAGGLSALAVGFTPGGRLAAGTPASHAFNPFVTIDSDGRVTVIVKHFEMGQGTSTGLPTLVAEELDADWEQIAVAFAPADNRRYANLAFGIQSTGGSTAIANSFLQYRQAGAAARDLLVRAAAGIWGADPADITVQKGMVGHGGKTLGFGALAAAAAGLTPAEAPRLKDPSAFRLIGDPKLPRKDSQDKTDGRARFAMDMKLPGMVVCVLKRPPRFGARVRQLDSSGAEGLPGFVGAKSLPDASGVAVYGKDSWSAIRARDAIEVDWDMTQAENRHSDRMLSDHLALLAAPHYQARKQVDPAETAAALAGAAKVVEAEFHFPFLAHAPMEPLVCVIEPTAQGVRLYDGSQFPANTQPTVAELLGLEVERVEIETLYAGGSFGRRATPNSDYQAEAAMAFALLGGETPVKLVWTREDDLGGGYYRPMAAHRARIALDQDGRIRGWDHRLATKSILKGSPFESFLVHDGVDHTSVEGLADSPYALPAFSVGLSDFETPIPVLWWRSVGHTHNAYAMEVMMDLAAEAAGQDPVAYRLSYLEGEDKDRRRLTGVLKLAAEKAGWSGPTAPNRGRGVAVHKSFDSYVAEVVEVSGHDGAIRIEKVTCAVDCGLPVNPDIIKAQMEGGIGYGLGAVMRNEITLSGGEVEQLNFPDYEPLRIADIGPIEVHILPSAEAPTGVGEPGLPPAGPALANAIRALSGTTATQLPMIKGGIAFS